MSEHGVEKKVHEWLRYKDYYEAKAIGNKARSDKTCEHCGKTIQKGTPHYIHHFYPEFAVYPTCIDCDKDFIESLIKD